MKTMTKQSLQKKYQNILDLFEEKTFEDQIKALFTDLINYSEAFWDYPSIRYDTVMTLKEWKEFSEHPERIPYKSKIEEINSVEFSQAFEKILLYLKDFYSYYKQLPESEFKEDLKKLINSLMECSFNARFETEDLREADAYVGRSIEDRDNGNIKYTEFSLQRFEYAINEYAKSNQRDAEIIKNSIFAVCENDLLKLSEAVMTCDIPEQVRRDIAEVSLILARDLTLEFSSFQLAWRVWCMFREIGIDTKEYLNFLSLPDFEIIKEKLLAFMNHKAFVEEMLQHLQDDLPESYEKYIANGVIDRLDINIENAKRKKYPKKLRSDDDIQKMITESESEVYKYFPLAKERNPRSVIFNPTHPACTSRASNSTVKNLNKKPVNTVVMTPRTDHKDDYLPTFAHETTHALHRIILDLGENSGVLKKGSADSVATAVMEDFSQLVDDRFESDKDLPYTKKFKGKEFPNFLAGFTTRFQVPFSLAQLSVRVEFDRLYDEGYRGPLTESMIWNLKYKFDALVHEWFSTGINIKSRGLTAFRLVDPYNPRDGVVYMKRYMMVDLDSKEEAISESNSDLAPVSTSQSTDVKLSDAFIQKWGENWINDDDARIMLHWLLLETGRNEDTHKYYKFIFDKPVKECLEELQKIGLTKEMILGKD